MKSWKLFSIFALCAVLLCVALFTCSCSMGVSDESEIYKSTEKMLVALLEGDRDAARALMSEKIDDASFDTAYAQLRSELAGVTEYELEILGWKTGITDGVSYTNVNILVRTENADFLIFSEIQGDAEGLSVFQMRNYEITGTLATLGKSNAVQIILLAVNLVELAFVIWAFVDCARSNIDKKAIWLSFMFIGRLLLNLDLSGGGFGISLEWLFGYTSLLKVSTGETVLTLAIPVMAIVWFALRRQLKEEKRKKDEAAEERREELNSVSEEEE